MRFTFDGKEFQIEFSRNYRNRVQPDQKVRQVKHVVRSTYPDTTVKLLEVDPTTKPKDWTVYKFATVGCHPTNRFTLEGGRLEALRKLGNIPAMMDAKVVRDERTGEPIKFFSKEFRRAMWTAYNGRFAPKVVRQVTFDVKPVKVEVVEAQPMMAGA